MVVRFVVWQYGTPILAKYYLLPEVRIPISISRKVQVKMSVG